MERHLGYAMTLGDLLFIKSDVLNSSWQLFVLIMNFDAVCAADDVTN